LSNGLLIDDVVTTIPEEMADLKVRDLWVEGVGWDMSRIEPFLSTQDRLRLLSMVVDTVTGASDRVSWGPSQDGRFSVKSAASFLQWNHSPRPNVESLFGKIWKCVVPERIRVFMWLIVSQVIMTNSERFRRHLCDSNACQVCICGEETIFHVLRDCPAMSGIWNSLVARNNRAQFFSQSLLEWIYANVSDGKLKDDVPWLTVFGMAAWWGWKWRCGNVFGVTGKCRDRVRFVKDIAREVYQAHAPVLGGTEAITRVERLIAWEPPPADWVKLNTDGASRGNPGLAAAGGVLRDREGRWIQGFALNIGVCSAPLAEL